MPKHNQISKKQKNTKIKELGFRIQTEGRGDGGGGGGGADPMFMTRVLPYAIMQLIRVTEHLGVRLLASPPSRAEKMGTHVQPDGVRKMPRHSANTALLRS